MRKPVSSEQRKRHRRSYYNLIAICILVVIALYLACSGLLHTLSDIAANLSS